MADSLVKVAGARGYGSGVVIESGINGTFILTNKHVCDINKLHPMILMIRNPVPNYTMMNGKMINSQSKIPLQVVKVAKNMDLCLVHANVSGLKAVDIVKHNPSQGTKVFNVSNPQGLEGYVATGYLGRQEYIWNMLYTQHSIPTYGGSSGSGIYTMDGKLTCLVSLGHRAYNTIGYCVPASHIRYFLKGVL